MFAFLLQKEGEVALETRLDTARLREEDALRFLRIGELAQAGALAKDAADALEATGEGKPGDSDDVGAVLAPRKSVDVKARLEGLGRLIDATSDGLGVTARPALKQVMVKRLEAITAYGKTDYDGAAKLADEGAKLLVQADPAQAAAFDDLWRLQQLQGSGQASYESLHWTRPMLSMTEQLTLVLVLELAFGVIFELPLVMALLGLVGLVSSKFLFKYQRHAFVLCLILAAIITPTGDVGNLSLMAGPMLACYELGVLLVWLVERKRKSEATAGQAA